MTNEMQCTVDEDHQSTSDINQPIYPNARLTNAASMLLIVTFSVIHKLSGEALKDLLSLIDLHCLLPHALIQSLYKFKKYFAGLFHPIKKHYYCPSCSLHVDFECTIYPNPSCKKLISEYDKTYFIELCLEDQLTALFKRKGFYNSIQHRFTRKKSSAHEIEDICDGVDYQAHMQPGDFLSNCHSHGILMAYQYSVFSIQILEVQHLAIVFYN